MMGYNKCKKGTRMKKILFLFLILITGCSLNVIAAENYDDKTPLINYTPIEPAQNPHTEYPLPINSYQSQGYNYNQLKGNVVMVPAGTTFAAVLVSPLSSASSKLGDSVTFFLNSDFYYGKNLIAPQGSRIKGTVIMVKRGGMANKQGQIQVKFTNIVTPNGQMIPVSASILTDDGGGVLKAGTAMDVTKDYVKNATLGAAAGAVIGTALGAISSGGVGRGAIYGTALGGGMALVNSFAKQGSDVDIPQNVQMNIILDQPITVSSNTPY